MRWIDATIIIGRYRSTGANFYFSVFIIIIFFFVFFSVRLHRLWLLGGVGVGGGVLGEMRFARSRANPGLHIFLLVGSVVCVVCLRCTHLEFRRPIWAASIPGSLAASADPCLPLTVFVLYICGNNTSNHYSVRYLPQNKHAIRSIHLVLCVYMYIVNK